MVAGAAGRLSRIRPSHRSRPGFGEFGWPCTRRRTASPGFGLPGRQPSPSSSAHARPSTVQRTVGGDKSVARRAQAQQAAASPPCMRRARPPPDTPAQTHSSHGRRPVTTEPLGWARKPAQRPDCARHRGPWDDDGMAGLSDHSTSRRAFGFPVAGSVSAARPAAAGRLRQRALKAGNRCRGGLPMKYSLVGSSSAPLAA